MAFLLVMAFLVLAGMTVWTYHLWRATGKRPVVVAPHPKPLQRTIRLTSEQREGFIAAWNSVQARFSTDPTVALIHAVVLISALVQRAGRDGRSIEPYLLLQHQIAHGMATSPGNGPRCWDDLERAMGIYGILFDGFVGARPAALVREAKRKETAA